MIYIHCDKFARAVSPTPEDALLKTTDDKLRDVIAKASDGDIVMIDSATKEDVARKAIASSGKNITVWSVTFIE